MLNYNIVDSIINNKSLYPCADDYNKKGIIKADLTTLGCAIFSMKKEAKATVKNKVFEVESGYLHVVPHTLFGSLNFYDKKTLIYILSKLAAFKREDGFIPERFYFTIQDFCKVTEMGSVGGKNRKLLRASLDRLKYTGFILSKDETYNFNNNSTALSFLETITHEYIESNAKYFIVDIPKWLRDELEQNNLLTLNKCYFQMTNPFQSRLYDIARKYCGAKKSMKLYYPTVQSLLGTEDKNIRKLKYKLRLHGQLRTEDNPEGIPDYYVEILSDHILIHNDNIVDYSEDKKEVNNEVEYNESNDEFGDAVLKDIPKDTPKDKPKGFDNPREVIDIDAFIEQTPIGMTFFNRLKDISKDQQVLPNDIVKNKSRWTERGYNDIYSVKRETPPNFDQSKNEDNAASTHVSVVSDKTIQEVGEVELYSNLETIIFQHKASQIVEPLVINEFISCFYNMFKQAGTAGAAIKKMIFHFNGHQFYSDDEDTKNKLYNMYCIGMKKS